GMDAQRRYESIAAGPAGSPRAPSHVVRALRRGLAVEPDARFPDMDALLEALIHPSRAQSWRPSLPTKVRREALSVAALASVLVLSLVTSRESTADGSTPIAEMVADAGLVNARTLASDGRSQQAIMLLMHVMPVVRETDENHQYQYL